MSWHGPDEIVFASDRAQARPMAAARQPALTQARITELREQASKIDGDTYTSLHWAELLKLLDLAERGLPGVARDL